MGHRAALVCAKGARLPSLPAGPSVPTPRRPRPLSQRRLTPDNPHPRLQGPDSPGLNWEFQIRHTVAYLIASRDPRLGHRSGPQGLASVTPPRLPAFTEIARVAEPAAAASAGVFQGNFAPVIPAQVGFNGHNPTVLLALLPADSEKDGGPFRRPHGRRSHDGPRPGRAHTRGRRAEQGSRVGPGAIEW